MTKAIRSAIGDPSVDDRLERELSAETGRRAGRACRGQFMVSDQVFLTERRAFGDPVMTAGSAGASLYPEQHRADLFIDRLRSALDSDAEHVCVRGKADIPDRLPDVRF